MPTYYIDFENGNDANTGLSFAQRWKTITNGATAARIAPGDEIRIMASPDPTSIGNATWTGGGRSGSIGIQLSSNTTPIVITTFSAHGLVTGDYVVVGSATNNTNVNGVWRVGTTPSATTFQILQIDGGNTSGTTTGTTGNMTKANNLVVKTASPLVQNIALCGGLGQKPAWTSSSSVTTSQNTTVFKEGNSSAQIALAAGFTTGKAAYYTLPSTLDLSAYQQVSFWVRISIGTVGAADQAYLALCTDTLGDTVVHQCNIPNIAAASIWFPVTVNLGTNLNAAIRSIALYIVTDVGTQTFVIDNIVACKAASSADSVTLQSLVSKSDGTGDEAWYAIQSINNDVIMLANDNLLTSLSTSIRGYNGASEAVTTYKRGTVKTAPSSSVSAPTSTITDSGTSENPITYSGGWNRTDMSTQTGRTWLDGQNGLGIGLDVGSTIRSFINIDKIDFCRYGIGLSTGVGYFKDTNIVSMYATANATGISLTGQPVSTRVVFTSLWANNNNAAGISMGGYGITITDVKLASNNALYGFEFRNARFINVNTLITGNSGTGTFNGGLRYNDSMNCVVNTATITNCRSSQSIIAERAFNCFINGGSSSGGLFGVYLGGSSTFAELYLNNYTINETSEVGVNGGVLGSVYSNRHDNTDNNSWIFQTGLGTVNQQTSVVDSPATTAWLMRPTSSDASATAPVLLKLGTVVCAANSLVTVTARMQRNNTQLNMRLVCPGGQITGVDTDVFTDMTAAANTWETVTITFTPTKAGGVDIYAHAFGGTSRSGYVCNLTASQA
jgi:hypothetical protein